MLRLYICIKMLSKIQSRILADILFVSHLVWVTIILFGWWFTSIEYVYLGVLISTLVSELVLGYCILTKWEFDLRKKLEPNLNYNHSFISYYGYKYFRVNPPDRLVKYLAILFLTGSLIVFYVRI